MVKAVIYGLIGAFAALAIYYHIPRTIPVLLSRGDSVDLPSDYEGPRFRNWHAGEEI